MSLRRLLVAFAHALFSGSFDTAEPLNFRDDDLLQPNPRPRPMTEP